MFFFTVSYSLASILKAGLAEAQAQVRIGNPSHRAALREARETAARSHAQRAPHLLSEPGPKGRQRQSQPSMR